MSSWITYLRILGAGLVIVTVLATYRGLTDDDGDPALLVAVRGIVLTAWGIGLYARNRWIVRLTYSFAIGLAILLWGESVWSKPPLAMPELIVLSVAFVALGILVFVPRANLTGYTPFRPTDARVRAPETGNPYQPPSPIPEELDRDDSCAKS